MQLDPSEWQIVSDPFEFLRIFRNKIPLIVEEGVGSVQLLITMKPGQPPELLACHTMKGFSIHLALLDLLEEVVRVRHPEAVEGGGHRLDLIRLHEAGVAQPLRQGEMKIGRGDVHLLAAVPEPHRGPQLHRAVSFLTADLQDGAERFFAGFGGLGRGGLGHEGAAIGEKGKRSDLPLAS